MAVTVRILPKTGYKFNRLIIRRTVGRVLEENGVGGKAEVVVSVVGEEEMKRLNQKYLESFEPTDVLSFPLDFDKQYPDGVVRLGDVVMCYPEAVKQAKEKGKSLNEELEFLVEHGCRHLLGIHHD